MADQNQNDKALVNQKMRSLVIPVFLIAAAAFYFGPKSVFIPLAPAAPVNPANFSSQPKRKILGDPPIAFVNGFDRTCMDCHKIVTTPDTPRKNLIQHTNIKLNHGLNDGCLNCHDKNNRDLLTIRGGKTIPFTQTQLLCSQCHGPTYRDWQRGMHGKTLGFWNETKGQPRKLLCTECHDPHAPAFEAYIPLPGPNTLRMGDPNSVHYTPAPGSTKHNPLRTWSKDEHAAPNSQDNHNTEGDH